MIQSAKAVICKDEKYLLLKRSEGSNNYKGSWEFPGGKFDQNESLENCLIRETFEETNLVLKAIGKIFEYRHQDNVREINFHIVEVSDFEGKIKLSEEHLEYSWVSIEELENYCLSPIVEVYFKEFKNEINR